MAFFTGTIFSEVLNMEVELAAMLPHDTRCHRGVTPFPPGFSARERPRTLLLLHGLTDGCDSWSLRTKLFNYMEDCDVAVVMPGVQRSFYQDMACGEAYFTFVSEELPALAADMFNVSVAPEDLLVAGQSMGGYGALRCGLTHPERFRAVGAFSSVIDVEDFTVRAPVRKETRNFDRVVKGMFGEGLVVPEDAKLDVLAKRARGTGLPIYMACGTEDAFYPANQAYCDSLRDMGFNVSFNPGPGIHGWDYWDGVIRHFLSLHA